MEGQDAGVGRRAFVAGATGYTGQAVVKALVAAGVATVAHIRPDSPRRDTWTQTFEGWGAEVDCTPWEAQAMVASLARHRPTLVFGLLGTTKARMARERASGGAGLGYEQVDLGMTLMVLRAAEPLDPAPRFVYLSSLGVRPSKPGSYYHARWEVEQALKASRLPWTIARPSFVTGPDREERRPLERGAAVVANAGLGLLARLGGARLRERFGSMSADELSSALVRAALDPACAGAILEAEALRGEG